MGGGPNIRSARIRAYRWLTLALAVGYCLYQVFARGFEDPGGPFRYLTIWALFLSAFSAGFMVARSYDVTQRRHHVVAMCASVLNVMVVFLYWRLYFNDPALVNGSRAIIWYQEYYLHGLGPVLQIVDALFFGRVFRSVWRAALPLIAIIAAYVTWAELFVQRFNEKPVGTVTSGLPYPFLNNLEFADRAVFYLSNSVVAIVLLAVLAALGWAVRRLT